MKMRFTITSQSTSNSLRPTNINSVCQKHLLSPTMAADFSPDNHRHLEDTKCNTCSFAAALPFEGWDLFFSTDTPLVPCLRYLARKMLLCSFMFVKFLVCFHNIFPITVTCTCKNIMCEAGANIKMPTLKQSHFLISMVD